MDDILDVTYNEACPENLKSKQRKHFWILSFDCHKFLKSCSLVATKGSSILLQCILDPVPKDCSSLIAFEIFAGKLLFIQVLAEPWGERH